MTQGKKEMMKQMMEHQVIENKLDMLDMTEGVAGIDVLFSLKCG